MQLMHHAGIKNIVGTCSTETKEKFLKSIGATDVINFTKIKNLGITFDDEVQRLCSNGIDIAYESIGGEVLDTVIDNIGKAIIYNIPSDIRSTFDNHKSDSRKMHFTWVYIELCRKGLVWRCFTSSWTNTGKTSSKIRIITRIFFNALSRNVAISL